MIDLLWNNPIGESRMDKYIRATGLHGGQRVLDVGCGCGEVLIRIHERFQIQAIGIDRSSKHIIEARRRAKGRVHNLSIRFVEADAQSFRVDPGSLDLAVCMGASHAYGVGNSAYANALARMIPMLAPGGRLLITEGYMKRPAAPDYRRLLGDWPPDEMTHAANVATGVEFGLTAMAAWTSSEDEWDDFEWTYQQSVERLAEQSPGDSTVKTKLATRRQWMDAYLRWGRDSLGYGIYLFKRQSP